MLRAPSTLTYSCVPPGWKSCPRYSLPSGLQPAGAYPTPVCCHCSAAPSRLGATRRPRDPERVDASQAILSERSVVDIREGFGRPPLAARDRAHRCRVRPERYLVAANVQDLSGDVCGAIAREKCDDRGDRL